MARIPRADREATNDGWLALRRAGLDVRDIARESGFAMRTVWEGIQDARFREARNAQASAQVRPPRLGMAYGSSCKALPQLTCGDVHPAGPMPEGSRLCCYACHRTGIEDHPGFRRDPATDPRPEPRPKSKLAWMSRTQRRAFKRALKTAS